MGEYAEMEIDAGIGSSWGSRRPIPLSAYQWKTVMIIEVLAETEKAWHILIGAPGQPWKHPLWFPKSKCTLRKEKQLLEVPGWLWVEKVKEYGELKRKAQS